MNDGKRDVRSGEGRLFQEGARLFMRLEEGFNLLAQLGVIASGLGEVGGTSGRISFLQRVGEDLFNPLVLVCIHRRTVFNRARRKAS
jgi:hypothetical protein